MHQYIKLKTAVFLCLQCAVGILSAQTAKDILRRKIQTTYDQSKLSGFAVSIVDENGTLFSQGYGFADKSKQIAYQTDHIQIIASISKTWVGVALMQCVEKGLFTLETNINDILPFKVVNPNFPDHPIKIKDLATHTSSITYHIPDHSKIFFEEKPNMDGFSKSEKKEVSKILSNKKIEIGDYLKQYLSVNGSFYKPAYYGNSQPGAQYKYSNMATTLAAYLVEVVTETSFDTYCKENITKPLGLSNTAFNMRNPDLSKAAKQYYGKKQLAIPLYAHNFYPTGGLRTSNKDLNLFLIDIISGYRGKGKLLSPLSYQTLLSGLFEDKELPENFDLNETNHGVFWTHRDELIGHTGGGLGVSSFMFFDKNTGIGKIFVTNCELESNKELVGTFVQIWQLMAEYETAITALRK